MFVYKEKVLRSFADFLVKAVEKLEARNEPLDDDPSPSRLNDSSCIPKPFYLFSRQQQQAFVPAWVHAAPTIRSYMRRLPLGCELELAFVEAAILSSVVLCPYTKILLLSPNTLHEALRALPPGKNIQRSEFGIECLIEPTKQFCADVVQFGSSGATLECCVAYVEMVKGVLLDFTLDPILSSQHTQSVKLQEAMLNLDF